MVLGFVSGWFQSKLSFFNDSNGLDVIINFQKYLFILNFKCEV